MDTDLVDCKGYTNFEVLKWWTVIAQWFCPVKVVIVLKYIFWWCPKQKSIAVSNTLYWNKCLILNKIPISEEICFRKILMWSFQENFGSVYNSKNGVLNNLMLRYFV